MKKYRMRILGIFILIVFVVFQIYMTTSPNTTIKNIKSSCNGTVISYIRREGSNNIIGYKVKGIKSIDDIYPGFEDYFKIIQIGDTIIKPINENYCEIIKLDGTKRRYIFTYISKRERNDFRWPREWKNKWLEATVE